MIRKWQWLAVLGVVVLTAQCAQEPTDLKTEKDKVNYGIGVSVARNFKQQGMDVDVNLVAKGMRDEIAGKKLLMSDDELRKSMVAYQQELRRKQMQERKIAALENKKEGDAFLEANKKKEGVVTTQSGLQYKVLKEGNGPKPTTADMVEVIYRGTLINGKEFDTSGPEPKPFRLAGVIPGWREALQLMPAGSKWQVVVPSELAYGERGMGQVIMPNAVLLFDLELVNVKPAETKAPEIIQQLPGAKGPQAPKAPQPFKPPEGKAPPAVKPPEGKAPTK